MSHEDKDYIQALRARGYRVTPQRLIVLDAVCALDHHATFADIHAKVVEFDPSIDRSTIYRALDVLVDVGLVVQSDMGDAGKVYKISGEANHHHLICNVCGDILTVESDAVQSLIDTIKREHGFIIQADHLSFPGICARCARQPEKQ